jgi:hypothetical protein
MRDPRWDSLVETTLSGVEPCKGSRDRLALKLRESGDLGMLYVMWTQGGDPKWLARILRRLAEERTEA